jgi:hypothetical protein
MFRFRLRDLAAFSVTMAMCASANASEPISGPVTQAGTAEFTVNATRIRCTSATTSLTKVGITGTVTKPNCPVRIVGDAVTVFGSQSKKDKIFVATSVETQAILETQVDGFAVVDAVSSPTNDVGETVLRADGYTIHVTKATKVAFLDPLPPITPIATNLWLRYSGKQHADGSVTATTVTFSPNVLKPREERANQKQEFDPSAVKQEDKQSGASKFLLGKDLRRIPASNDPEMQQRIEKIGARLVPAYQRSLAEDAPAKINFRFQLVDEPKFHDAATLSNGIILVPKQVVEGLDNDSQIATVLADNIACAMEKQALRLIPASDKMLGTHIAAVAVGVVLPGAALAAWAGNSIAASQMLKHAQEQSGRVSLALLHDAGYDLTQAPLTWWQLSVKQGSTREKTLIPYRTAYLYSILATNWRSETAQATGPFSSQ